MNYQIEREEEKMKKTRIRNKMMKAITWCMAVIFILSVCSLDSPSWIPTIVCAISLMYLSVAVYIDNKRKEEGGESDVLHR